MSSNVGQRVRGTKGQVRTASLTARLSLHTSYCGYVVERFGVTTLTVRCVFLLVDGMRQLQKRCGGGGTLPAKTKWRAVGRKCPRLIELIVPVAQIFWPSGNLNVEENAGHFGQPPHVARAYTGWRCDILFSFKPYLRSRLFTVGHFCCVNRLAPCQHHWVGNAAILKGVLGWKRKI